MKSNRKEHENYRSIFTEKPEIGAQGSTVLGSSIEPYRSRFKISARHRTGVVVSKDRGMKGEGKPPLETRDSRMPSEPDQPR